ncbi:hypothetical protein GJ744_006161 [Endocarpon pusillum]|uniref:Uncharacterized protein n=1 Tax=Endocarpon pusillum TaxID=364733 RepID=A0A8H7A496_9EURO|nr:hypothetical protein GJ744_006161 [Endocarpon pusillum]
MRSARHMSIQGMDILEIDIAIAAAELRSVNLRPEVLLECFLAITDAVTLGAEAMPCKGAVVLQNVIALTFLSTVIAELDSNRTLGNRLVIVIASTFMRDEVSTSPSVFFQVGCVTINATTKAVEGEIRVTRHGESQELSFEK